MGTLAITIFPDQGPSAPYRHAESHQFTRCIQAEVIAVAGDRIAACGSREAVLSALKNAGREFTIDESFAGAAMIPGLIEAHSHITSTGGFYQMPAYVG